jgi:hypothetical protein
MDYSDPFLIDQLSAAATLNTASTPVPCNNARQHFHEVTFKQGVTAGKVVVEVAPVQDFAGTWDELASWDVARDADLSTALGSGDAVRSISLPGPSGFVRHRIATAITGGGSPSVTSKMRRIQIAGF